MNTSDIISPENLIYKKPDLMNENHMHYCPGCSHGVVHKVIAEVIEELGLLLLPQSPYAQHHVNIQEIGRASCRERV